MGLVNSMESKHFIVGVTRSIEIQMLVKLASKVTVFSRNYNNRRKAYNNRIL